MCEANAYIVKDGQEELVMESVDIVEPEEDHSRYRLVNIFGKQKVIRGRIALMNLVDHKSPTAKKSSTAWRKAYLILSIQPSVDSRWHASASARHRLIPVFRSGRRRVQPGR